PTTFLPPDSPSLVLNEQVRKIFPDDEVFVLLFEGVALYSDGFLEAYDNLASELETIDQINDVISLTRQDHISGSEDGFTVEPLVDIDALDDSHPRERLDRILNDRFARNSLVASDGSAVAMIVIPEALDNSILNLKLEEQILELVETHQLQGYLSAMAGEITTDVAQMRMVLRDNMVFIPATVFIGLLLTWILFQRVIAVIATGVVTGAVVNTTIMFYVIFQQPFNTISGIIPPLLSALTIAALVHFYNALHYASKRGLIGKERVQAALSEIRRPAFFSALTTSVGLASLGLSPIPPIKVFGLASAAGVFLIYLIVIYLLPPIFAQFDHKEWPSRKSGLWLMDKLVEKLYHLGMRRPKIVISTILVAILAASPMISKVGVETNILEFFPPEHELRQDINHIEQKLVGTTPLEVVFTSSEPEGMIQPETLKKVKALQAWLEAKPSVDKTLSIADFIEEMHWGFHAEDP
ncbi:MAG: MMPL family transporter, partial [Pseudomonadota bacterium]